MYRANRLPSVAAALILLVVAASASIVSSRSGVRVNVSPSAAGSLQCVINYVESHGVRITAMRGYGRGTVRGSLHPGGNALDINQYARNRTRPHVPAHISNAAADACGVISGARWGYADNGHWNLGITASRHVRYARRHYRYRYARRHYRAKYVYLR